MLRAPKSVAFIEPDAMHRFVVTIRCATDLCAVSSHTVTLPARLHDLHATVSELEAGVYANHPELACLVLFTSGPLTLQTVEAELFSNVRAPIYCVNRCSALAWGVSEQLCRFVLVDFRWPGSVALIKRDDNRAIDDVRLFEQSMAAVLRLDSAPNARTADLYASHGNDERLTSWLADILAITSKFGYTSTVLVSEAFDGSDSSDLRYHPREILHRGAVRAIRARASSPGVWVDPLSESDAFAMRTTRDISYSVVQLQRAVYDDNEPTLSQLLEGRPALFAVDTAVDALYGDGLRRYIENDVHAVGYVTLDGGEANKSSEQVERIQRACIDAHLPRNGVIVGVGGGVVLDIAGMAAAQYRRGVSYVRVATTFLAMIDVAVGIKHGVNLAGKKNIVGTFYPPTAAINDPLFLRTNSPRQLACGVAEAIKIALVADPRLFHLLEEHLRALLETGFQAPAPAAREILKRAQIAMMVELAPNLFETDLKRAVDFGHSISPLLEAESNYTIAHGEAVAIDMLFCTAIAVRRGLCARSLFDRLLRVYGLCGLPVTDERCTVAFVRRALSDVTAHRGGNLNLLVPIEPGRYEFLQQVSDGDVRFAIDALNTQMVTVAEAG